MKHYFIPRFILLLLILVLPLLIMGQTLIPKYLTYSAIDDDTSRLSTMQQNKVNLILANPFISTVYLVNLEPLSTAQHLGLITVDIPNDTIGSVTR